MKQESPSSSREATSEFADRVEDALRDETNASLGQPALDESALASQTTFFSKIKFNWRPEDRSIMERIESTASSVFADLFSDVVTVIDNFYAAMRVPETTPNGTVVIGPDRRVVWKRDEDGRFIERLDQLTGQDIDLAILELERLLLTITPRVNRLMLDAVAAHHIQKDAFDSAWFSVVEGTQGDRTARANQRSQQDRWFAFFKYYVYSDAQAFLGEVNAFLKRLENVRFRQAREYQG